MSSAHVVELLNLINAQGGCDAPVTHEEWERYEGEDLLQSVLALREARAAAQSHDEAGTSSPPAQPLQHVVHSLSRHRQQQQFPATPETLPISPAGVSLQDMDKVFKSVLMLDSFVAMLQDGVGEDEESHPEVVHTGCSLTEYTKALKSFSTLHQRIAEMTWSTQGQSDDGGSILALWGSAALPPEVSTVLLRWLTHMTRTATLLCNVLALLFARDESRATEHEMQLSDPSGLVVATVETPCTKSGWCAVLARSWLGRPVWGRHYAVLWQQFLYLFESDAAKARCVHCILLRGCKHDVYALHEGRQNVICFSNFLSPYSFNLGQHAAPRIYFEENAMTWVEDIGKYVQKGGKKAFGRHCTDPTSVGDCRYNKKPTSVLSG